jgi:hypothetical protein
MCENIIELAMSDDLGQMEANSKRLAIGLVFGGVAIGGGGVWVDS